jgi:hypothetical protein
MEEKRVRISLCTLTSEEELGVFCIDSITKSEIKMLEGSKN